MVEKVDKMLKIIGRNQKKIKFAVSLGVKPPNISEKVTNSKTHTQNFIGLLILGRLYPNGENVNSNFNGQKRSLQILSGWNAGKPPFVRPQADA